MRDQRKAEAIAVERVQLLSPLLAEGLDAAKVRQIKARICEQTGLSERTIRRYLAQYQMSALMDYVLKASAGYNSVRQFPLKFLNRPFSYVERYRAGALLNLYRF